MAIIESIYQLNRCLRAATSDVIVIGRWGIKYVFIPVCLLISVAVQGLWFISSTVQAASITQDQAAQLTQSVVQTESGISAYTETNLNNVAPAIALHRFYAGDVPDGQLVTEISDVLAPTETEFYAIGPVNPRLPSDPRLRFLNLLNGFYMGDMAVIADQSLARTAVIIPSPVQIQPSNNLWDITGEVPLPKLRSQLQPLNSVDVFPYRDLPSDSVKLNWTLITYLFIGLFVLSGFFKGWWKEAVTTFFLVILVLLLRFPDVAQWIINRVNEILETVWGWIPQTFGQNFGTLLGIDLAGPTPRIDAGSGGTWLVILFVLLGLSILISRSSLPNQIRHGGTYTIYVVKPLGAFLGGLLGGLNGFLIVNLVREYLIGSNLPTDSGQFATTIASTTNSLGVASTGVDLRVIDLPNFINLPNPVAWIIIGGGFVVFLGVLSLSNRLDLKSGIRRVPRGHNIIEIERTEERKGDEVKITITSTVIKIGVDVTIG